MSIVAHIGQKVNTYYVYFGRAGRASPNPGHHERRGTGAESYAWTSIDSSVDNNGYGFYLHATTVRQAYNLTYSYGNPLRCLVNSTVGEKENSIGRHGERMDRYTQ